MTTAVVLSPEQDKVLSRYIAEQVRKAVNQIDHGGGVRPVMSFFGQFKEPASVDLTTGALIAPNNKVKPMRGPAAPDPTTVLWAGADGVTVHYLVGGVLEGVQPWCDVWEWQGYLYVYPWSCGPAAGA